MAAVKALFLSTFAK